MSLIWQNYFVILTNLFLQCSPNRPTTGLKNAQYKRKALHVSGWAGRSMPNPTKLGFNIHNSDRRGPYDLISMSMSLHNGFPCFLCEEEKFVYILIEWKEIYWLLDETKASSSSLIIWLCTIGTSVSSAQAKFTYSICSYTHTHMYM